MTYIAAFLFPFLLTYLLTTIKKCESNEEKTPLLPCLLLGIDMLLIVMNNPFPF